MNYRYKIQESLNENEENYTLKTNKELINMIIEFGCGETEFHTADIERLIKEHQKLIEILNIVTANLSLSDSNLENDYRKTEAIKLGKLALDLYSS